MGSISNSEASDKNGEEIGPSDIPYCRCDACAGRYNMWPRCSGEGSGATLGLTCSQVGGSRSTRRDRRAHCRCWTPCQLAASSARCHSSGCGEADVSAIRTIASRGLGRLIGRPDSLMGHIHFPVIAATIPCNSRRNSLILWTGKIATKIAENGSFLARFCGDGPHEIEIFPVNSRRTGKSRSKQLSSRVRGFCQ